MGGGFQPALPMRGVTFAWSSVWPSTAKFQPALPMRGVTFGGASYTFGRVISTRTPHAGSDLRVNRLEAGAVISTRTPHAGSDQVAKPQKVGLQISTRTPHAGSDRREQRCRPHPRQISTRTPHAGSDCANVLVLLEDVFQPALPMRGVTSRSARASSRATDFNPHSPCGE